MVPSILVYLENLPLTINGKLDRKALPDPEFTSSDNYVAPRNELESKICHIWGEVLGLGSNKVGIRDDFFRSGGDSIVSIQLVSRLRQRLGLHVSVKDIFNYKNIERLYDNVIRNITLDNSQLDLITEQGTLVGEVPLLPIQEWFFENNFVMANYWNQSFIVKTPNLDLIILRASIAKLIERHDSFRLRYKKGDLTSYSQYYDNDAREEELKILDIRSLSTKEGSEEFEGELHEILSNWQSSFNIEHGPTYNIGYIHGYVDGSSRIWFALHHLIVDSVSWRILSEDLRELYNGLRDDGRDNKKEILGSKGSSYRQWVNVVREYANTHDAEKDYWINILSGNDNNELTKSIADRNTQSYASLQLSQKQTSLLLQESNRAYNTQVNDILLTALGYILFEITERRINYIVLEGHGREEIDSHIDISRTIGWFTTMYPVRLEISEDLGSSLKNIKEALRQVPNKGIGYGSLIGYDINKLPRISFNYLGQFDQEQQDQFKARENSWQIISEDSGISVSKDNHDHNILNINGLVIDGELKFSIVSKLDQSTTSQLAILFKEKLEEIIYHTVGQTRSYLTVSDIDNIISQGYLDRLQEFREIGGV